MTLNKQQLTLNCDMGESFGSWKMGADDSVMPHVDMANIACGFHASDPNVMHDTITLAIFTMLILVRIPVIPTYKVLVDAASV